MPSHTVLLVDDDPHIREVVRYTLEKEGIRVIEAESGREGLGRARENRPDMIVLDIMMPEMSGLDMCRELRKSLETPILFLSSKDSEIDRIIGLEIGGDDYGEPVITALSSCRDFCRFRDAGFRGIFQRLLERVDLS